MKIGFIGCGNMAKAMIRGILAGGKVSRDEMMASARSQQTLQYIREELKILCGSNADTAAFADILFLAVKPQYFPEVIGGIRDCVRPETVIVSLAPGKTIEWLTGQFGRTVKLVRTMPNTPAMVGEGMTGLCAGSAVTEEEMTAVLELCGCFGKARRVSESLMDTVVGVSGSSPAYIFILIEAMADAAVAEGMPRKDAYEFAAQSVMGSAKMVLETGKHPAELKDMVCSPGGTTIEAVRVLEEKGFRSAVIEAVKACVRKSRGM